MRILILSCNTGGGHNSCSAALKEQFDARGDVCHIADALEFVSPGFSRLLSGGHVWIYRHFPQIFRVGYAFLERHRKLFEPGSLLYRILSSGWEKLRQRIQEGQYDAVLCPHVLSTLPVKELMRREEIHFVPAFLATDYTCSPGGWYEDFPLCFIPHESLDREFMELARVQKEQLVSSGIPIRKDFCGKGDKARAKEELGIPVDHRHLLMMCGSMGCGPMKRLVRALSREMDQDMDLTILCGTNEKLRRSLARKMQAFPQVHVQGFRKDVSRLMDSADLYLTKPGGLSTTEAAAKHLPMAFVDAVAGCEGYNLHFFLELGAAITADKPETLARETLALLRRPERLAQMSEILQETPWEQSAALICERLAQAVSNQQEKERDHALV